MRIIGKLVCCTLAAFISVPAFAQDLDLDFHFLKLGLSRKAVVDMLGPPTAQSKSKTLFAEHRRLIWIGPDGQKYTASFIQNHLWQWRTCSPAIKNC